MAGGGGGSGGGGRGAADAEASDWWQRHFAAFGERIPFKALFFPLLLQACGDGGNPSGISNRNGINPNGINPNPQLSQDELAALVRHCVSENAWTRGFVTRHDFLLFVARFGPLELTIAKVVSCFCVNGELVPWFHGLLGRAEADRVLAAPQSPGNGSVSSPTSKARGGDGTFLIRFSESHPTKFTLSYVKIHSSGPHAGRREMKNCLIENLGHHGYALTDSKTRTFSSILSFVQRSVARLKHGVPSEVARHCNSELAEIRALQDRLSNAYTAFSAETLEMASEASPSAQANRSLLFSQSPPRFSMLQSMQGKVGAGGDGECCAESYSGFTLDALAAPLQVKTKAVASASPSTLLLQKPIGPAVGCGESDDAYCEVGHFFGGPPEKENNQLRHNEPAAGTLNSPQHHQQSANPGADYGSYISFAGASVTSSVPALGSPASSARFKQLSPSSRATRPGFAPLLSPARRLQQLRGESSLTASQDDEYATFESFASTFAGESEELARRNRLAVSFSKGAVESSAGLSASLTSVSAFGSDDTYGSFASLSITKPSAGNAIGAKSGGDLDEDACVSAGDYGNFASLANKLNAGMVCYQQKQLDEALARFIHAQEVAKATDDKVVEARALGNLGTVYLDMKNAAQAVVCYQRCLDITRSIKDTKRERTILNNLVLALMASEEFERALACCEIQLEMTTNEINRRKIFSRMSLLREKAARANRERNAAAFAAAAVKSL